MMETLGENGIHGKDQRIIMNLYWNQKAIVQIGDWQTKWMEIRGGLGQRCALSPDFLNLNSRKLKKNWKL